VWSIKLQQIFDVLQPGRSTYPDLIEEGGIIRHDSSCQDLYHGTTSESMICAENYTEPYALCAVRIYNNNKFVCEIFILYSNAKKCISLNPVKAVSAIFYSTNSILLTASTNCKNQMTMFGAFGSNSLTTLSVCMVLLCRISNT
jgi:hypothetical protein